MPLPICRRSEAVRVSAKGDLEGSIGSCKWFYVHMDHPGVELIMARLVSSSPARQRAGSEVPWSSLIELAE